MSEFGEAAIEPAAAAPAPPSAAVLSAQGLGKHYGALVALRDVSFSLHPGELVALIGPNGSGKTTLLSLLAGVLDVHEGQVSCPAGARGLGWVPQHPAVYSKLTVAENLALWARLQGVADPAAAVTRMLEQTDLGARADEQVTRLSGGNRQRVNIAVGLLAAPQVLLLDEPSASLDPIQRARMWEFVRELTVHGTSVLFSTHEVVEAERSASRVLVLNEGRLLFDGTPQALAQRAGGDFEAGFVALVAQEPVAA